MNLLNQPNQPNSFSSFDNHCDGLTTTKAQCRQTGLFVLFDHFMQQGDQHAASAGAYRVADSDTLNPLARTYGY